MKVFIAAAKVLAEELLGRLTFKRIGRWLVGVDRLRTRVCSGFDVVRLLYIVWLVDSVRLHAAAFGISKQQPAADAHRKTSRGNQSAPCRAPSLDRRGASRG